MEHVGLLFMQMLQSAMRQRVMFSLWGITEVTLAGILPIITTPVSVIANTSRYIAIGWYFTNTPQS